MSSSANIGALVSGDQSPPNSQGPSRGQSDGQRIVDNTGESVQNEDGHGQVNINLDESTPPILVINEEESGNNREVVSPSPSTTSTQSELPIGGSLKATAAAIKGHLTLTPGLRTSLISRTKQVFKLYKLLS